MTQPQQQLGVIQGGKPALPKFEGMAVEGVTFKISGTADVNNGHDTVLCVDDRVRLVGDFRVVGINFKVASNGDLVREHIVKPLEFDITAYDPNDPTDTGVWRSRPNSVPTP